jgi:hypothetical protein
MRPQQTSTYLIDEGILADEVAPDRHLPKDVPDPRPLTVGDEALHAYKTIGARKFPPYVGTLTISFGSSVR